jgi:hypothetical protein
VCEERSALLEAIERDVAGLQPAEMTGELAAALVEYFSRLERLAACGTTLCAARVIESSSGVAGDEQRAGAWLAAKTGESVGRARRALEAARKMQSLPDLEAAYRGGELSSDQVAEIAEAASEAPSSEQALLEVARSATLSGLRREADRVRAAARSAAEAEQREEQVRARRSLRSFADADGALRIELSLTPLEGRRALDAIEAEAKVVFDQARTAGRSEPYRAYLADAFVRLVTGTDSGSGTGSGSGRGPKRYSTLLRVDLAALRRGGLGPGEVCEIPGAGPVSLSQARKIMGETFLKLVIADGVDVATVCHPGRTVAAVIDTALEERDPTCVVPGCNNSYLLERDHWQVAFGDDGPTCLDNLARLCHRHHLDKTHRGYRLEGGPGRWRWVAPAAPTLPTNQPDEVLSG